MFQVSDNLSLMSSFIKITPDWKKWACVDDHFGHHQYGYAEMQPDDTWETFNMKTAVFLTEDVFYDMYYPKVKNSTSRVKRPRIIQHMIERLQHKTPISTEKRTELILLITKFLLDNPEFRVWQWLYALDVMTQSAPWSWALIKDDFNLTDDVLLKRVRAAIRHRINSSN